MQAYANLLSGLSPDSSAFRKRAPRVQLSDDPDTATVQTVQEMCRQIHQAARDPLVLNAAVRAVHTYKGGPQWALTGDTDVYSPQRMAESCWWWCKWNLRFKHHGKMFEAWAGDLGNPATKLQLLIAPDVLVRMKRMEGDCAIYTMMLCAMLEALSLPWQIVTLAVDHFDPTVFSHVCARCNGESLDASHGPFPGWQVPAYDVHRLWVFDQNGSRVADSGGARVFNGLHEYRRSGLAAYRPYSSARNRRLGLGATVCDDAGCYDDGSGTTGVAPSSLPPWPASGACTCVNGTCIEDGNSCNSPSTTAVPTYTAPSSTNTAQWASFATQLAKMGFTLAQINAIQPGTVVSANGAILRQNPGYSVPVGSGVQSAISSLGSSNVLMYGLLGIGALFVVSSFGGRR